MGKSIGICFGEYAPMHRGHLSNIMFAKKQNDIVYVFVCGYDGDLRAKELGLNLDMRYNLISEYFKGDEIIRVKKSNDTDIGIDESYSNSNWAAWLKYNLGQIDFDPNKDTVSFYVGETSYIDKIKNNLSPNVLHSNVYYIARSDVPISGTKCRKDPIKNWKYITKPFRPYMTHRILVAGTASEGKTTLVRDIGRYFNIPYSYEKGRDTYGIRSSDKDFNVEDFIYNLYEQNKLSNELMESDKNNSGVFISDTDNIVTLMYAYAYSKRDDFALRKEDYSFLYEMAKKYNEKKLWDKIFLIGPSKKDIVDDGQRYMPDSDYDIRCGFYENLKKLYTEFGYDYEELNMGYDLNFYHVKNYIENLGDI